MSDILFDSALNFKKLLDTRYLLTFGRKNVITNLTLDFNENNFCHLAGLHKLKDMHHLRKDASFNFNQILNRNLTYAEISRSSHAYEIQDRLRILSNLELILDQENTNWKYCQDRSPFFSKVRADFLIEHKDGLVISYIFITKNSVDDFHSCNSCFEFKHRDYTKNQTQITLLEKKKFNKLTSSCEILYRRASYTPFAQN